MQRKNGLQFPLHPQQIISWVITGLNFIEFYLILLLLPGSYIIPFGCIYALIVICIITTGVYVTVCNPESYSLGLSRTASKSGKILSDIEYPHVCNVCEAYIKTHTKHCGNCQKCIEDFDHHCKWVNNCIGSRNYRWFVALVASTLLSQVVLILENLILLTEFIINLQDLFSNDNIYGIHRIFISIFSVLFSIESLGLLIGLSYLLSFHIWIRSKNMTTYDYILNRRNAEYSPVAMINKGEEKAINLSF